MASLTAALARCVVQFALMVGLMCGLPQRAQAAEYYVATTGNDASAGTLDQPFATLRKAVSLLVAGDTVWIRGGTYRVTKPATSGAGVVIDKSGASDAKRIRVWAYPGEVPVFDFAEMQISTTGYTSGFAVSGSWLHLKGLEIRNVPMNTRSNTGVGVNDPAHHDIFEQLNIHHISGTGLFISHGGGGHLILNSDSHDNYDPTSTQGDGQNADGFGAHYQDSGEVTTFRGCRAWWNSDDGWDLISQEHPVVIENSWAFGNGYIDSGKGRPADGNDNGFKAGSSKTGIRHVLRNNLAWGNRAAGFYANHSAGGNDWYNNTAYRNGSAYNLLASTWDAAGNRTDGVKLSGARAHRMRNNVGFPDKNSYLEDYGVDSAFNTWDLGLAVAEADFASVSDAGFMGARQADGSLPELSFLHLRAGSPLVDQGTDVQLPFVGAAPDLGAYELGAKTSGGSGGAGGNGGQSGDGGASAGAGGWNAGTSAGGASGGTPLGGASSAGQSTAGIGAAAQAGSAGVSTGSGGSASSASNASDMGDSADGCSCRAVGRSAPLGGAVAACSALALAAVLRRRSKGGFASDRDSTKGFVN